MSRSDYVDIATSIAIDRVAEMCVEGHVSVALAAETVGLSEKEMRKIIERKRKEVFDERKD